MSKNQLPDSLKAGISILNQYGFLSTESSNLDIQATKGNAIVIEKADKKLHIIYDTEPHFYMALARSLGMENGVHTVTAKVEQLGFMLDCSRNAVAKPEMVKRLICLLVLAGYNYLELYTEETYELPQEPYFGYKRGRYSVGELREIIEFANIFHVEMVPCIQTFAHLSNLANWLPYFDYMDIDDILLVGDERTYDLIRKCLRFWKEVCHTKRINIGGDEAFRLGRGKYLDRYGYREKHEIYLEHMKKVFEICKEEGVQPEFWGDGLYDEQGYEQETNALFDGSQLPILWEYSYSGKEKELQTFKERYYRLKNCAGKVMYAGGLWKWYGFAPDNTYSKRVMDTLLDAVIEYGVNNVLMTAWGDNGNECSVFATIPALWYATQKIYACDTEVDINKIVQLLTGYTCDEWQISDRMNYMVPKRDRMSNAAKYILYNDFIIGLLDYNIPDNAGAIYQELFTEFLKLARRESPFSYIFKSYEALCRVLARKATYGKRLYQAYQDKDTKTMMEMVEELQEIKKDLEVFYDAFRKLWLKDYKGFGFEVMDVRIGGLIARISTVTLMLQDYLAGNIEHIYELEEERLEYFSGQLKDDEVYAPLHGFWASAYTVNHI